MGKAIIIPDISFALNNLGTITFIGQGNNKPSGGDEPGGTDEPIIVVPQYNLWDILYTDGNGNLSVSSEVLDTALGKTPIAICIAKTGFFGENEKARWMALKYLNRNIGPNNGDVDPTTATIYFGPNVNIQEISDVTKAYVGATGENQDWGVFENGNTYNNPVLVPNVYDSNGDWNLSELGTIGDYAVTDIDGKTKTAIYQSYVTAENWQTSIIGDNANPGNWPAVMAAWHYAPSGTQQGDWYIGACGEYALMENLRSTFVDKITLIHTSYPNDCYEAPLVDNTNINGFEIWTATERDNGQQYRINTRKGQFGTKAKNVKTNGSKYCIPLLQY
jgi:hypothetical protein